MKKVISIIVVLLIVAGGIGFISLKNEKESKLDQVALEQRLQNASQLVTQEMVITDVKEFDEGSIPYITKNKFLAKYTTTVKAGFDLSEAELKLDEENQTITVTIPHCQVFEDSIKLSSDDIDFYDTSFSLFKIGKEDTLGIISQIEDEIRNKSKDNIFLEQADNNSINLVKGLFVDTGYDVIVEFKKG